jgi:type I restriction enzyme, S subunit
MNKLVYIKIGNVGVTITGKTPSSENPEDFGNEFMFITPSDSFDEKIIYKTHRYLSKIGLKKLSKKALPPKSILVTCIGTAMGKVIINNSISISNQQINSIVPNENFHPDYIYYNLKNNYKLLRNAASGSTALPMLNKTDFDELKIPIYLNLKIQQNIASVLSSLDSKIELNNRINTELEAMTKTLYDYWFVQFDFPDKNVKPYKSNGGKMVWNEELKREVPKGWAVQKMADWINIDKSGDWGKEEFEGNFTKKVTCIRGADINGLNGLAELKPPTRYILEKNSFKILNSHDLIIEISGGSPTQSTGRLAYITEATIKRFENPLICSNFCKPISLKNKKLLYNFVYYWNSLYDNGTFFGYEGKTSGIKNLLLESFVSTYYTVVPDENIVNQFYDIMENIQEKKQLNLAENQQLASLRDWLLPMLMNGQVRVGDAYLAEEKLSLAAEGSMEYCSTKVKI